MRFQLPAEKVHAAACACIKSIDDERNAEAEAILKARMAKRTLFWGPGWPFLYFRHPSREEAIQLESYAFSDYRTIKMRYWNQYDTAERIRDAAAAVMQETSDTGHNRLVTLTDEDWERIGGYA